MALNFVTWLGAAAFYSLMAAGLTCLVTSIRALLRSRAGSSGGPREIVCRLNGQSSQDTEETGQFVTLVVIKFLSVQCPSRNGGFNSLARLER